MVKGLFTSTEGMLALMAKQDQIANNLANINTSGYKNSKLLTKSFSSYMQNDERQPFVDNRQMLHEVYVDYSQGPLNQTDNPLDAAIEGEGFFVVETPHGRRYTRNGNFSIDRDGYLVTSTGNKVIAQTIEGKDKLLKLEGKSINVQSDGTVAVDGIEKGRLRVVTFPKPFPLAREGEALYKLDRTDVKPVDVDDFEIHQGFLEVSNADPVQSMVEMISSFRHYEANQKSIHAQDETLKKAVNEIGKYNA